MLENKKKSPSKEIVGSWDVPLRGKIYKVEFEHGTTTGKRVLWIDGQVWLEILLHVHIEHIFNGFYIFFRKSFDVIGCSNWLVTSALIWETRGALLRYIFL